MQMDAGLDTGAMLLKQTVVIAADDNAQTLHDKLAAIGAQLILRALRESPRPVSQENADASYAAKISKAEARIDWAGTAVEIDRMIRAFNPVPGAYTVWNGQTLKIWRAEPAVAGTAFPGTVLQADHDGVLVAAGDGVVRLLELQRAGGKRLSPRQFLAGTPISAGTRFDR